jgi:hypothetical protein
MFAAYIQVESAEKKPKFHAHLNGVIFTGNKSVNYFPGSVASSVSTGGQYG